MSNEHRRWREALGAYVVGALEPAERHEVEAHLSGCSACRDELAGLSVLPPLLGRLSAEEASAELTSTDTDAVPRLLAAVAEQRRRSRRALWTWRGVAAAAVVAAVLVAAPWSSPTEPDVLQAAARPVAADASAVTGTADAYAWEWGTTVQLDVARLPARDTYILWVVSEDGRRQQAGAWGPTAHRGARVRGASAIARADIARVEVTDAEGQVLLTFPFR